MEPETLLFETSPFGSLDAMVEQDERAAYLYLHSPNNPNFGTRAVWIRNLIKGPLVLSEDDMQMGIPPVLPRTYCATPEGKPPLTSDGLQFVWFEEGNGIALLDQEEVVAVIPPWSGFEGFHGYSIECRTENQICWPMPQQPHLHTRIRRAAQFWNQWERNHPFKNYQTAMLEKLKQMFPDQAGEYFSIGASDSWWKKGIQSFQTGDRQFAVTIGIGLCAMPNAELSVENPSTIRRAEFAIEIPASSDRDTVLRWISGLSNFPWQKFTWFGHGHTSQLPEGLIEGASGVYFCDERVRQSSGPIATFQDDPVNLLWLVPITGEELEQLGDDTEYSKSFAEKLVDENRLI